LTRPRLLGIGFAVVSLAFAACGKSNNSTPAPVASSTPISTISPTVVTSPCVNAAVAYEPDNGNGGLTGVQTVRYESSNQTLCGAAPATPQAVAFGAPVGSLAFAPDASVAIALLRGNGPNYNLAQDVFGAAFGQITPVGATYPLDTMPTPASSASPTALPTIPDASSVTIVGTASQAVALTTGPGASAIVALTSLTQAPPIYGNNIPFAAPSYSMSPQFRSRSIVQASPDGATLLLRGSGDLVSFEIALVASGFQFNAVASDATLGSGVVLRGRGNIAFSPVAGAGRALVGGTSSGGGSTLTLVTGLPKAITRSSTLTLPGNINSIVIDASGTYGYVATDAGIVTVKGVNAPALSVVTPGFLGMANGTNVLPFTNCNAQSALLTQVQGIGLSADGNFLVALGTQPGTACASARNASVVAIPFSPTAGVTPSPSPAPAPGSSSTPAPKSFVQNNVIGPPAAVDDFLVR